MSSYNSALRTEVQLLHDSLMPFFYFEGDISEEDVREALRFASTILR
ncbi:MAG: hypothetical protein HY331_19125 [Chloroflexi bacterium]|nr:hypothetical protein [Chloroflexota bacterium]